VYLPRPRVEPTFLNTHMRQDIRIGMTTRQIKMMFGRPTAVEKTVCCGSDAVLYYKFAGWSDKIIIFVKQGAYRVYYQSRMMAPASGSQPWRTSIADRVDSWAGLFVRIGMQVSGFISRGRTYCRSGGEYSPRRPLGISVVVLCLASGKAGEGSPVVGAKKKGANTARGLNG